MSEKEFLLGLAYDDLTDEEIIRCFSKYFVAKGLATSDACRKICLLASATAAKKAGDKLQSVFENLAEKGFCVVAA